MASYGTFHYPWNPVPIRISETGFHAHPLCCPGLVLSGNPLTRGQKYGLWFGDKIRANVDRCKSRPDLPSWEDCLHVVNNVYIPAMAELWPHQLEELEGMSGSSRVPLQQLVLLNTREDLAAIKHLFDKSKTDSQNASAEPAGQSLSASFPPRSTSSSDAIVAHSWTSSAETDDSDFMVLLEIHHHPAENLPSVFLVTEAGMISGSGMNSAGLTVTGDRLFSSADFIPEPGSSILPLTCVERSLLENSDITGVMRDLGQELERHTSKSILVADQSGSAFALELAPRKHMSIYRGEADDKAVLHANHFFQTFDAFQARRIYYDRFPGRGSAARLSRLRDLVALYQRQRMGELDMVAMFSDHQGSADGNNNNNNNNNIICQHADDEGRATKTAAFVMFNTTRQVISVCKGPPCNGHMVHFTFGVPPEDPPRLSAAPPPVEMARTHSFRSFDVARWEDDWGPYNIFIRIVLEPRTGKEEPACPRRLPPILPPPPPRPPRWLAPLMDPMDFWEIPHSCDACDGLGETEAAEA